MVRMKPDKRKSAGAKKAKRRKKPVQHKKPKHSKRPSGDLSAQIHQGVGFETSSPTKNEPEIPQGAADDRGES